MQLRSMLALYASIKARMNAAGESVSESEKGGSSSRAPAGRAVTERPNAVCWVTRGSSALASVGTNGTLASRPSCSTDSFVPPSVK